MPERAEDGAERDVDQWSPRGDADNLVGPASRETAEAEGKRGGRTGEGPDAVGHSQARVQAVKEAGGEHEGISEAGIEGIETGAEAEHSEQGEKQARGFD
ncbi:MAG: hypothetical protein JO122_17200, partial [Acetobacteraceae bacterium]|nr:hypothetical protein [Acetobacteraceae bacterium]